MTDTQLVLLPGAAGTSPALLSSVRVPGRLGDASQPSPYLPLFPGNRSRFPRLGLRRAAARGRAGPDEQRGSCVRSTGGLAAALPAGRPGRGLAGCPGCGPARGLRAAPQRQRRRRAGRHRGNAAAGREGSAVTRPSCRAPFQRAFEHFFATFRVIHGVMAKGRCLSLVCTGF